MPTAIAVTSPDLALSPSDRQTPAAVVLQAPHLQPLDEALTETSAVLEHHGHLIALYSSACPSAHIRRLHTLRAVLESDRIAIVPLSLPPLGVAVLARQLRQLSLGDFSPGVLASAARLLTHYIHAGALLGSVGGLDHIEVDLRSHVKSWLPGVHFAVLAHPEPQLVQLDRHGSGAGLPAPGFTTQLALARGQFTGDWVTTTLAPAWQVQGVYEARLPDESARWWGTRKLIEFAAAIPDPSVLHQLVSSVRREQCGWCGQELLGDRCAFCAAPLSRARAAGGGGPAQGPAAIAAPGPGPRPLAQAAAEAPSAVPDAPSAVPGAQEGHALPEVAAARATGPAAGPGAPEHPAVRGPERTPGGPEHPAVRGPEHPPGGPAAPGNPYGSGPPVPGNPYASDTPCAPARWDLPGHASSPGQASFAGHPDLPGHPDLSGRPGAPGTPRTVARVR
ncbi:hypothetical protein IPZ61_03645 [Streptomyces sioyaensis]|uniref:hypothetical protein n=1 Tax=Streptomyces sioyaensis TaxID=67364 RepID=UPI0027E4676F|nr:hypothetical protein [Streptomyces sioyaensis]MCF3172420.1 hypothetical protein [Streptomyces sioyaensis]